MSESGFPELDEATLAQYSIQAEELLRSKSPLNKRWASDLILKIVYFLAAKHEWDNISNNDQYGSNAKHHTPEQVMKTGQSNAEKIRELSRNLKLEPPLD